MNRLHGTSWRGWGREREREREVFYFTGLSVANILRLQW